MSGNTQGHVLKTATWYWMRELLDKGNVSGIPLHLFHWKIPFSLASSVHTQNIWASSTSLLGSHETWDPEQPSPISSCYRNLGTGVPELHGLPLYLEMFLFSFLSSWEEMILCKMPTKVSNKEEWAKAWILFPPAKQPALPLAVALALALVRVHHLSSHSAAPTWLATLLPLSLHANLKSSH